MSTYIVRTLGCKANLYDSQRIEAELKRLGWVPASEEQAADLCIVNSCTVTDEADRQSRKLASRLSRENPAASVVLTGCAAEVDPERLAGTPGVHYVIGNQNKPDLVERILRALERPRASHAEVLGTVKSYGEIVSRHPMDREWPAVAESFETPELQDRTRAFLKVQEGCNAFCTYCIIPYGRGPAKSLRPREVITQIRELTARGVREVVLTGTNLGDFGVDWSSDAQPAIDELLELIFAETTLERLRVSSLDPTEISDRMLALMASEPRFCPHFHVSLQSPDTRILKLMKRKYGTDEVVACLEKIGRVAAPVGGVYVGMDIITGFPGETAEDFERGVELLSRLPWSRLHVFPYSERSGTPATRLPGAVPQAERVARARSLNELSLARQKMLFEKVLASGELIRAVLLEKVGSTRVGGERFTAGYSPNYLKVLVPADAEVPHARNSVVGFRPARV
ncbi:MAG: tRNA (N(6)-L-threonylcarbamoyladenosine(37)-C(2))-methylthiotransferase MtaB, partial [Bdellovibrionota bacterium]